MFRLFTCCVIFLTSVLVACAPANSGATLSWLETQPLSAQSRVEKEKSTIQPVKTISVSDLRKSCPLTLPIKPPFIPPAPYSKHAPSADQFWYGTDSLWTALPKDGVWFGLPHDTHAYTQKVFWWRDGYSWREEPEPDLTVTGRRLDAPAPQIQAFDATNAYAKDIGSAMLVGIEIPTDGCWAMTGQYGSASLRFVIWVAPREDS